MSQRYFLAKLRGEDDASGVILRADGSAASTLREATSLLSHLHARPVREYEAVLIPYFPPERRWIDLSAPDRPTTDGRLVDRGRRSPQVRPRSQP